MTRTLLLTFDAFGTLFHPRLPIPTQYASTAASYNLLVTPDRLQSAFKSAYKAQSLSHPNYGRDLALRGQYAGPRQWWEDVIRASFAHALDHPQPVTLPSDLIEDLLDRFASSRGYTLYDDVKPFFEELRKLRRGGEASVLGPFERVVVGVVSNSDDRITTVLQSLGVSVGDARGVEEDVLGVKCLPGFEEMREEKEKGTTNGTGSSSREGDDIDFVVTSYQAGAEKPDRLIYDVARRQAGEEGKEWECVHIGDDYWKDYRGALDAGWKAYFLPRGQDLKVDGGVKTINSLLDLFPAIEAYK